MPSRPPSDPEPEAVFSPKQWNEIARSLALDDVPLAIKQEICDALFAYHMDCIAARHDDPDNDAPKSRKKRHKIAQDARERDALEEFVEIARTFRIALYRFQQSLSPLQPMSDRAEQLGEEIFALQRYAAEKLQTYPKSKGGRPSEHDRDALIFRLLAIYTLLTGKQPSLNKVRDANDPDRLIPRGPTYNFIFAILDSANIPTRGLQHVIQRAAREVKARQAALKTKNVP